MAAAKKKDEDVKKKVACDFCIERKYVFGQVVLGRPGNNVEMGIVGMVIF